MLVATKSKAGEKSEQGKMDEKRGHERKEPKKAGGAEEWGKVKPGEEAQEATKDSKNDKQSSFE